MNKTIKIILSVTGAAVILFGGVCAYGVWDYVHRCVGIDHKEEVECIYEGESYAAEDLFNVRRASEDCEFTMEVIWEDGSDDGIVIADDSRSFTVTEGTGTLRVRVGACNPDSPEGSSDDMVVTVIGQGVS